MFVVALSVVAHGLLKWRRRTRLLLISTIIILNDQIRSLQFLNNDPADPFNTRMKSYGWIKNNNTGNTTTNHTKNKSSESPVFVLFYKY